MLLKAMLKTAIGLVILANLLFPIAAATSLHVDNAILGDPYVSCGPNAIEVRFDTRNSFKGLIFVDGHLDDPECRSAPVDPNSWEGPLTGARNAQIRLQFKQCGIERKRSTAPKGVFLGTTLVVAFHPQYLTKHDRIFHVHCFYMEAERVLQRELAVNMPQPMLQTAQVPMPVCRYEVLEGGPYGQPLYYATIGQMVYHKWTCDTVDQQPSAFCMTVHDCNVDDGNGDRVELIDSKGCARDKYLLQNLDYVSDLLVGKEAHVYKYADRPALYFDCKISLSVKEPGQAYCDVPNCPDPPRRRRHGMSRNETLMGEFTTWAHVNDTVITHDVELIIDSSGRAQRVNASDFTITREVSERSGSNSGSFSAWLAQHFSSSLGDDHLCMSYGGSAMWGGLNLAMIAGSLALFRNAYKCVMASDR